ncbi:PAS domain-containing protein [Quadrisphaera sp. KR29]|uniref:PAS domain-containing protein n=1 Tax=Quadrisphaera sp. KR29 TaxID=3461391 RepID=UPI0040443F56
MPRPSGVERTLGPDELIVSKTDLQGRITYANESFLRIGAFTESQVIGQPHNIIRHPEMPRAVFKLLWDTVQARQELFAYVVNLAADGAHYWVLAHVTPSFDASGAVVGYHSNRRSPHPQALAAIKPLYARVLAEESKHSGARAATAAGAALLAQEVSSAHGSYDEFVWSLEPQLAGAR